MSKNKKRKKAGRKKIVQPPKKEKINGRKILFDLFSCVIFTLLIYLATAFIKFPLFNGYVHMGDGLVFLAGAFLPMPYAIISALAGGALADLTAGFTLWLPATAVIKVVSAACFTPKKGKLVCKRNILALIPAWLVCVAGYYIYEIIFISNNFISPLSFVFPNTLQVAVGAVFFIVAGFIADSKDKLKIILSPKNKPKS